MLQDIHDVTSFVEKFCGIAALIFNITNIPTLRGREALVGSYQLSLSLQTQVQALS